ncbi:hypothetical protein JCM6882_009428 [Rhodosporidiobolus microsporus]
MPTAPTRAHTHETSPPSWTDSGLSSYRKYNERFFEPYLRAAFAPSVKPFFQHPSHIYHKYTSDFGASIRRDASDLTRNLVFQCLQAYEPILPVIMTRWHEISVLEREDLCLQVWEQTQRRAETADFDYRRVECPEFTLSWAEDPFNFDVLLSALTFSEESGLSYRHVPNEAFDRLNGTGKTSSTLPFSPGVRAFCEESKIMRSLYLTQFSCQLIRAIVGIPEPAPEERQMFGSSTAPSAEDKELLEASQNLASGFKTVMHYGGNRKHCNNCFKADSPTVKLTCCAKCKEINKFVWYCSRTCQVADWKKRHKQECGKKASEMLSSEETPRKAVPTTSQQFNVKWLHSLPFAVWGCSFQDELDDQPGKYGEKQDLLFNLPFFIRPYLSTLTKLVELRDRAILGHDDLDVGLLGLYIRKFLLTQPDFTEENVDAQQYLGLLAGILELEQVELALKNAAIQEKIDSGEAKVDPLILSCFKQLETGVADPTLPNHKIADKSRHYLVILLKHDDAFFAFTSPTDKNSFYAILVSPTITPRAPAVTFLRSIAFHVFETSGSDLEALGMLALFVFAGLGATPSGVEAVMKERYAADMEFMWGLKKGQPEREAAKAEERLKVRTDEEGKLLQSFLKQMREEGASREKEKADKADKS